MSFLRNFARFIRSQVSIFLSSERGSVESGLVLIPLILLFLSVLQLPISTLSRTTSLGKLQNDLNLSSFISSSSDRNSVTEVKPLIGGSANLLLGERSTSGLVVTPFLLNGDQYKVFSTVIDENSNN